MMSLACVALVSGVAPRMPAQPARLLRDDDAADQPVVSVQTVHVQRAIIAQPVRAYGIVAASASNLTTVNLPYLARIVQMRVQAGQSVTRGTPLFVVQADPAAVLAANQAKSAVTLAQGELTRTQSLYDKGLATQSQLATARKAVEDAQQALAAQNQTGVANGNKVIAAPIDGVVLQVSAAQGDQVQPGAAILQLTSGSGNGKDTRANVMLGVEPSDVPAIHAGDTVTLHGLSTSLAKAAADGRVVLVGASVDQQSQLVNIGANVPLGQSAFIPGRRVSADIADLRSGTHWIVPEAAVLKDDKGAVRVPDHAAKQGTVCAAWRWSHRSENGDRYGVDGPIGTAQKASSSARQLRGC